MEETDAGQEGLRARGRRMSNEDVAGTKEDRMSDWNEAIQGMQADAARRRSVSRMDFGWGAQPIQVQAPMLTESDAAAFQADADALIRLHVRGVLTDAERGRAVTRLHKAIARKAEVRS